MSASAPPTVSLSSATEQSVATIPLSPPAPSTESEPPATMTPTPESPPAVKRRAASFQDRLPLRAPSRSAVASALASVSSATTERFAKFRSLSSDAFLKKTNAAAAAAGATTATTTTHPPPPPLARTGSWKTNVHGLARRARDAAKRAKSAYAWELAPGCAACAFELHGEDAGAAGAYFHVVSDGVSSPFARQSLAQVTHEPASSALLAQELVRTVQQALADVTNGGAVSLDTAAFESVVVDAVRATRIKCFRYRQSRLAATLSVTYFDRARGRLLAFSLGDSKCVVVRAREIVFESAAVLRDFNMPAVVNLASQVTRADYALESFALQAGDICMTFSDGVGDNLYKDDIERAVRAAGLQCGGSSSSEALDSTSGADALQQLCDELVHQSQMKVSVGGEAANLLPESDDGADSENASPNARVSVHGAPVRGLFPFATAAAREYRARALEECAEPFGDSGIDHLACSLALFEKHRAKRTLGRQELARKPSARKHHYNLLQLKRMAEMQTKKPDDITLFVTQFRAERRDAFVSKLGYGGEDSVAASDGASGVSIGGGGGSAAAGDSGRSALLGLPTLLARWGSHSQSP